MWQVIVKLYQSINIGKIFDGINYFAGLCVSVISIYTAYLRFMCKKIKFVNYKYSSSAFYGDKIAVVIENASMATISINKIYIVYDNKYKMLLKDFDVPAVLEPLKAQSFVSQEITSIYPVVNLATLGISNDNALIIETTRGKIYSPWQQEKSKSKGVGNLSNLTQLCTHTRRFNNLVLSSEVKYVLLLQYENKPLKTIFIHSSGKMSENAFGLNIIPKEYMKTVEDVQAYIDEALSPFNVRFEIRLVQ